MNAINQTSLGNLVVNIFLLTFWQLGLSRAVYMLITECLTCLQVDNAEDSQTPERILKVTKP